LSNAGLFAADVESMYGLVKGATGTEGGGKVDERLRPRQTFQPLFRDYSNCREAVLVDDVLRIISCISGGHVFQVAITVR
jgi:hypothetical protein